AGVPGAGEALAMLDRAGHQVLFATNNSSRAVDTVVDKIRRRTGYGATADAVVTSGLAAADLLCDDGEICFVFGSEELAQTLIAEGIEVTTDHGRATAVVVGLDRRLTYQRLTSAVLAVRRGARFIATNDDATYPAQEGQYPGCGALVAAVERAAQVSATVCGKPNLPMAKLIERRIEHPEVWMVGDRVETDLAMADRAGWGKILVLSGVTGPDETSTTAP
ncbi:MAG: HAD-IIA family hydrolase, partial [Phycisphaeraceae bacterium]|nr:HAD-IIA family hydrolase [Phycisphaeraceae bacterium]